MSHAPISVECLLSSTTLLAGFPIAKMAAKLSVGCTLDGIPNDITHKTPASFEPSIDYVAGAHTR